FQVPKPGGGILTTREHSFAFRGNGHAPNRSLVAREETLLTGRRFLFRDGRFFLGFGGRFLLRVFDGWFLLGLFDWQFLLVFFGLFDGWFLLGLFDRRFLRDHGLRTRSVGKFRGGWRLNVGVSGVGLCAGRIVPRVPGITVRPCLGHGG